nr:enoyl-CoA hydratase/isomerase family protein [Pseudomonas sp.]
MSDLIVEVKDGVQIMTLNRPEAKNAATLAMSQAMVEALDEFDRRDDIRIGIITGAGGTFCAGMDLKGFLRGERPSVPGRGFAGITEK